jgi:phosphatidylserine synthase
MIHSHIAGWVLALILFGVALLLHKNGKAKGLKIVQMILRVVYLLIVATGVGLLFTLYKIDVWYILKAVAGLWIIVLFEMILGRVVENRKSSILWIQFVFAWVLVLYLGFVKLPMSFLNP